MESEKRILSALLLIVSLSSLVFILGSLDRNVNEMASAVITYQKGKYQIKNLQTYQDIKIFNNSNVIKPNEILLYSCIDDHNKNHFCDPPALHTLSDGRDNELFKNLSYKTFNINNLPELNEHLFIIISGFSNSNNVYIGMIGLVIDFDTRLKTGDYIEIDKRYKIDSIIYDESGKIKKLTISDPTLNNSEIILSDNSKFKGTKVIFGYNKIIFYNNLNDIINSYEILGYKIEISKEKKSFSNVSIENKGDYLLICDYGTASNNNSKNSCVIYLPGHGFTRDERKDKYLDYVELQNKLLLDIGNGIALWEPYDIIYINRDLRMIRYKSCEGFLCDDFNLNLISTQHQGREQEEYITHYGTIITRKRDNIYLSIPSDAIKYSIKYINK